MKNKKTILKELDAIIAKLQDESDGSQQHQKDVAAYQLLREQYKAENLEAARHTFNFVMDTYLREMLPEECGPTLGFTRIKPVHKVKAQADTSADAEKAKEEAIIRIGIEMDFFEEHLRNTDGCDQYTTTAQAFRNALEMAYDAGFRTASSIKQVHVSNLLCK